MAYLFTKDNVMQSLRLGFSGAWTHDHPELPDPLGYIHTHCPQLIDSFVPPSERKENEVDADEEDGDDGVVEDVNHRKVSLYAKDYQIPREVEILTLVKKNVRLSALENGSQFSSLLREAFTG